MNVELLRKVQKHILEEPRRLNMDVVLNKVDTKIKHNPPCGTVGCIAGWTVMLTGNEGEFGRYDLAVQLLDLNGTQRDKLFREPRMSEELLGWPATFAKRYMRAKTAKTRAKVTSDRIDHFIQTEGRE